MLSGGKTWKRCVCLILAAVFLCYPAPPAGEAQSNPYLIWIDIHQKTLILYENFQEVKRWPVATGAWDTPTPIGVFMINSRFSGQMSGFGTCFLGLNVPWATIPAGLTAFSAQVRRVPSAGHRKRWDWRKVALWTGNSIRPLV